MTKVFIVMEQEWEDEKLICSYAKAFTTPKNARAHINEDIETTYIEWGAEYDVVRRHDCGGDTTIEFEDKKVVYRIIENELD